MSSNSIQQLNTENLRLHSVRNSYILFIHWNCPLDYDVSLRVIGYCCIYFRGFSHENLMFVKLEFLQFHSMQIPAAE